MLLLELYILYLNCALHMVTELADLALAGLGPAEEQARKLMLSNF